MRDACVWGGFAAPAGADPAADACEVSATIGTLPFTGFMADAALPAALSASAEGGTCLPAAGLPVEAALLLLAGRGAVEVLEPSAAGLDVLLAVDLAEMSVLDVREGSPSFFTEVVFRTAGLGAAAEAAGLAAGEADGFAAAGLLAGDAGLAAALMVSALVGELAEALGLSVTVAAGLTAPSLAAALAAGSFATLLAASFPALAGLAAPGALAPAELVRAGLSASALAAAGACSQTDR